jgi:hypothetical protein
VRRTALATLLLALAVCTPAIAQPRSPKPPPAVPFDFRAYAHLDEVWMQASQSFDAVLGTSSLTSGGVGVDIVDLWRGAFVRAGISRMGGHGTRVFLGDTGAISSNVPVAVRMRTVELGTGWRFPLPKRPAYTVYGGVGLLRLRYAEVSDFATEEENAPESFWGSAVFGGLEVRPWKRLVVGGEVQFRSVPDAIGTAGVSADFNETNLGGFVIRGLIGFRK